MLPHRSHTFQTFHTSHTPSHRVINVLGTRTAVPAEHGVELAQQSYLDAVESLRVNEVEAAHLQDEKEEGGIDERGGERGWRGCRGNRPLTLWYPWGLMRSKPLT